MRALRAAFRTLELGNPEDLCRCGCLGDYFENIAEVAWPDDSRGMFAIRGALELVEAGQAEKVCPCGHLSHALEEVLDLSGIHDGGLHDPERALRMADALAAGYDRATALEAFTYLDDGRKWNDWMDNLEGGRP